MSKENGEGISKLPKWAQTYINELKQQRDEAIDRYEKLIDQQTPCPFYSDDFVTYGKSADIKRLYFNIHRITLETDKVRVAMHEDRDGEVHISFATCKNHDAAYISPVASNAIRIVPCNEY